jgi:segregation and condensation protein A
MTSEETEDSEETEERSDATREQRSDDIPLDIAGHEKRDRPTGDGSAPTADRVDASDGEKREGRERADGGVLAEGGAGLGQSDTTEPTRTDDGADHTDSGATAPDVDAPTDAGDVEPVEVLVNLAKDGEIDPWDIDIVDVTDKFLDRIDEADLRTSGRALFYASVLLRMKGDAMLEDDEEAEEPWTHPREAGLVEDAPIEGPDPFAALESEMERRLERKRARGMPQTLDELVHDLREAERDNWWKESREYDTSDSPHGFQRGTQELDYRSGDDLRMDDEPTAEDVTGNAHAENVDEIIDDVYGQLREQYDQGRDEVLYQEIETAAGSRVQTFLGLLFLSHRGQVRLRQDELFGDLWIQDPAAATGEDAAIAD